MQWTGNRRALHDLIYRHKQGLETAIRTITGLWHIKVVFQGTNAYTDGSTIVLPNVDVFVVKPTITEADVENARAYFLALRGYAWSQAARIVESDWKMLKAFQGEHGSFALAVCQALDTIRVEHRFGTRGQGIAEAMHYTREQWVWPRFARHKERAPLEINLLEEVLIGLQVMLKHNDERFDHVAWKALSEEAKTFVERNADDLDSAHDARKMDQVPGTERLIDVTKRILARWKSEFEDVAPIAADRIREEYKRNQARQKREEKGEDADEMAALDNSTGMEQLLNVELPPILLVTTSSRLSTLTTARLDGRFIQRIERVPLDADGWHKLEAMHHGETRTMVIHPPDPELERQLDALMAALAKQYMEMAAEMAAEAKKQIDDARVEIERLPQDQQPYLVYTNANDRFTTTPQGDLSDLNDLREEVMRYYGVIERRFKILLRSSTKTRWVGNREEGLKIDQSQVARIAMSEMMPQMQLRPFKQKMEESELLNTVVGLLTDVSGSMCGPKLQLARYATLCFAECLDIAKMRFASWAFTSNEYAWQNAYSKASEADRSLYGRFGALNIETIKGFNESWRTCATRLPQMGADNQANYDADSVLWAARQLRAQKAKRRVLMVLSDGLPHTGEPLMQVARQQRHLEEVVKGVVQEGVEVVGVGICDNSVTHYYPNHAVVHNANDLPRVVLNEFEFLLLNRRR